MTDQNTVYKTSRFSRFRRNGRVDYPRVAIPEYINRTMVYMPKVTQRPDTADAGGIQKELPIKWGKKNNYALFDAFPVV